MKPLQVEKMSQLERLEEVLKVVKKYRPEVDLMEREIDFYFKEAPLKKVTSAEIGWLRTLGANFNTGLARNVLSFA